MKIVPQTFIFSKKLATISFVLAFYFFGFFSLSYAQEHFNDKHIMHLAKEYLRVENYTEAKTLFEQLTKHHPENINFKYYLGVCNFKLGDTEKALIYFKESSKDSTRVDTDFNYYLAKSFHLAHHFEDAITYYEKYEMVLNSNSTIKYPHTKKEIELEIRRCKLGQELMKKPYEVEIINLSPSVNTSAHEYMPVLSLDETELMFTSRRDNTTGGGKDPDDDLFYEDIYVSVKDSSNGWSKAKNMGSQVNTVNHDATVGLSSDGKKLFIYRSEPNLGETPTGTILETEFKENGEWSTPSPLKGISSDFWEPSGSISSDGKSFYFSSNRPLPNAMGKTNRDLYVSRKLENGEWGAPERLNDSINSSDEEDAPFIHPDGKTLYYSSNGKNSIGGFDIFKTTYSEATKTWSLPENIGFPINTAGDDIYIIWSADGKRAYFSSTRDDSYGGKDIYMATNLTEKHSMALMVGRVLDATNLKPTNAEVVVIDNNTSQVVGVFKADPYSGKFSMALPSGKNYGISISKEGYLFHSENIEMPDMAKYSEYRKDIYLSPFKGGASEVLKNIFFDTDKADLRVESKAELDKLYSVLIKKPNLHVQISGHTDDRASHDYNLVLSEARAVSVVQYLIDKGLNKNKIFAKGFGEINPIATNTTDEGRQNNRRIEFMILDTEDDAHSSYLKIKDSTMLRQGDELYDRLLEDFKSVYLKQQADKAPVKGEYLYYKVHFSFNESKTITEYSTNVLNHMIGYMEHFPNAKLKVYGHADYFGNEATNLKLASERAKTVYNYLTNNGLDKSRISLCSVEEQKDAISQDQKDGNVRCRRVEFLVQSLE